MRYSKNYGLHLPGHSHGKLAEPASPKTPEQREAEAAEFRRQLSERNVSRLCSAKWGRR